jgi:hypothetical protein
MNRRDLLKALAAAPLLFARQRPAAVTTVNGVVFGVETFSFHDLPIGQPVRRTSMVRASAARVIRSLLILRISVASTTRPRFARECSGQDQTCRPTA